MDRVFEILRQEYRLKVRTRAFILTTVLLPVFFGGISVLPAYFMSMQVGGTVSIAVVDESGALFEGVARALAPEKRGDGGERRNGAKEKSEAGYALLREDARGRDRETLVRDLGARVSAEELGGFMILPADLLAGSGKAAYYARNVSNFERNRELDTAIEEAVRDVRVRRANLDPVVVEQILKRSRLETFKVGEGGDAKKDSGVTFGLAYIVGMVFYVTLVIYGATMLRVVLEEKSSRSSEVMVSIVRPEELMLGKILGVGMVAITQMGIWAAIGGLLSLQSASLTKSMFGSALDMGALGVSFDMVLLFLLYFLLGFFFYAALFAAVGAMVSSESEAQQIQTPVMMPIVAALMLMFLAIREPTAALVQYGSFFPFFTPILMTVRICVLRPSAWEIALSIVIMLASIAGAMWLAGRVFRVGILMYGKRPTLPELVKWIRQG